MTNPAETEMSRSPDDFFRALGEDPAVQAEVTRTVDAARQEIRDHPLADIWKLTATQPDPKASVDVPVHDTYPVTHLPQHPDDITLPPRIS